MLAVRRYWLGALLAVLFASPSLAAAAPAGFTWESDLEAAKQVKLPASTTGWC